MEEGVWKVGRFVLEYAKHKSDREAMEGVGKHSLWPGTGGVRKKITSRERERGGKGSLSRRGKVGVLCPGESGQRTPAEAHGRETGIYGCKRKRAVMYSP